jgi:hypothetical protein
VGLLNFAFAGDFFFLKLKKFGLNLVTGSGFILLLFPQIAWKFFIPPISHHINTSVIIFIPPKKKNNNNESLFFSFENGLYLFQHPALPE